VRASVNHRTRGNRVGGGGMAYGIGGIILLIIVVILLLRVI
jgi:predicted metalloprotease